MQKNILLQDAPHLHCLNTLIGTVRWLVTWKHMGLRVTDGYCGHIPKRVLNVNGTAIMWDVPVITDSTIVANRPDIVLHDKIREELTTE